LTTVARRHQKNVKPGRLLGTWQRIFFQKKSGTKLFSLTLQKKYALIVFYLVLALESISKVKSCPQLRRVTKNNVNAVTIWEHGIWQFSKKNMNITFYLDTTKKIWLYCFLLSFGPRVHFQGKKLIFWQKKSALNTKFSQKTVKLSYFTLEKSFFFPFKSFFFH
jgi:hypothetical protein